MATSVLYFWSLTMDSSNSSSDLLALALGTHTVNIEQMTPEQRYRLVWSAIRRCEPLKYFPGFQSLSDLSDWSQGNRCHKTLPGALWVEGPLGRLFYLSVLRRTKSQGVAPLTHAQYLLLEDRGSGRFVFWEEATTEERDGPHRWQETARRSVFKFPSEEQVRDALTRPEVVLSIVQRLAGAAEHDSSKRFERLQRLEHATAYLRGLKDRLVIGEPSDPDDIPL